MLEGKTRSPEVRFSPLPRVQAASERPAHYIAGTIAAAGDGDGAHDHGRRFSDDDGGTTLTRH